jgi:hypothetical protein
MPNLSWKGELERLHLCRELRAMKAESERRGGATLAWDPTTPISEAQTVLRWPAVLTRQRGTEDRPSPAARVAPRPREHRAGRAHRTRAGPSDDPDLERVCEVCGGSLAGKRRQAKTCGDRCRQARHRERAALLTRYDVALSIVPKLSRFDERLDLLAAVIWPTDVRLSAPRLREAA